jgi:hypothetical protein
MGLGTQKTKWLKNICGMVITCNNPTFNTCTDETSLVVALKLKCTEDLLLSAGAMLLFYILHKRYLNKSRICFNFHQHKELYGCISNRDFNMSHTLQIHIVNDTELKRMEVGGGFQ